MNVSKIQRNARRALKDIGEATAWKMTVVQLRSACVYHLRAVANGYEDRLSADEINTLNQVVGDVS